MYNDFHTFTLDAFIVLQIQLSMLLVNQVVMCLVWKETKHYILHVW